MTTTVNDIEPIESQSLHGVTVINVFFHARAHIEMGVAQITSIMQTLLRPLPPGITPPLIIALYSPTVQCWEGRRWHGPTDLYSPTVQCWEGRRWHVDI